MRGAPIDPSLRSALASGLVIALTALIFVVDLLAPRGVALGAAYVCPVLLAFASSRRTLPLEVAAVASSLTLIDYFFSSDYIGAAWVVVVNRFLSVVIIWFVALLSLERRRIGAALRRSESRSAAVIEAAMDAIVIVDSAGRVQSVNEAAKLAFGGDVVRRPIRDLIPAWTGAGTNPGLMDALARRADCTTFPARLAVSQAELETGPVSVAIVHDTSDLRARGQSLSLMLAHLPVEFFRIGPDDEVAERHGGAITALGLDPRALLAGLGPELRRARAGETVHTCAPAEVDGRAFTLEHWLSHDAARSPWVLWFCVDVSERRRMERKVEVASKLAALGELAGNIAHEINNPIGIISAKARLLMTATEPLPERVRLELGKIASQCDRVGNLTRRLLNYVRPGEDRRQRVELRDPARKALALVTAKAQRQGVEVVDAMDGQSSPTLASPDELEQVFLNLYLNALDAMPDGGTLRVSSGQRSGRASIAVADTGVGMEPVALRRCFEPFFTTKTDHGTGLGLHICHQIVEGHGGEIEVESVLTKGSVFTVELPVVPETHGAVSSSRLIGTTSASLAN